MDSSQPPGAQNPQKSETRLVTAGRDTKAQKGFVNPPVFHGSTVLYPTAEDFHAHRAEFTYGRQGNPTTRALQDVLMALEGPQCAGVGLAPCRDLNNPARGDEGRRPYPGLRQCLPAHAQFLQWPVGALWRRDHLF